MLQAPSPPENRGAVNLVRGPECQILGILGRTSSIGKCVGVSRRRSVACFHRPTPPELETP